MIFFLYFGKKVPVRRTGTYRHKKALVNSNICLTLIVNQSTQTTGIVSLAGHTSLGHSNATGEQTSAKKWEIIILNAKKRKDLTWVISCGRPSWMTPIRLM